MRSLLFVPGHDARKLAKGLDCDADALILDLEDAVPKADKVRARSVCVEFLDANRQRLPMFVRINGLSSGLALDELAAVVRAQPYGIMLPKCSGTADVARVDAWLAALEARDGLPVGSTRLLPIVTETAASVFQLGSYTTNTCKRLCGLMWGAEDLAADIGAFSNKAADGRYSQPYLTARALTLMAASAAQIEAVDAVYTNFRDLDGLHAEALEALRDGFTSKAAIHPDQIAPIHAAFTPSADDIDKGRKVLAAFDAAPPGAGAVALDGRMLDRPHLRSALRLLARAGLPNPLDKCPHPAGHQDESLSSQIAAAT